jgi:hypothetical protein
MTDAWVYRYTQSIFSKENVMNIKPRHPIVISVSVFVGLAIVFAVLLFAAGFLRDAFAQTILVNLGSATFGAGLTFFLLRLTGQHK